jgi:hypothetical protein
MIDLNDLQKPFVAALALAAAATTGFVAGYIVGRDPETARRLARSLAGGLTRARVTTAEAMESLGDLWADARAEAEHELEKERFAAEAAAAAASTPVAGAAATGDEEMDVTPSRPARGARIKQAAKVKRPAAARRVTRRKVATTMRTRA